MFLVIGVIIISFIFMQLGRTPLDSDHLHKNNSIIPGKWIFISSKLFISNDTVNIYPGEEKEIFLTFSMGKEGPWNISYSYFPVEAVYSSTPTNIPDGLGLSIIPDHFTALPGAEYQISLKIMSSKTVQQGQYIFLATQRFNGGYENFWITVYVK